MALTVVKGYDTDYLTEAVAKGREGYYTGAVAAGEPPGLWYGEGAKALGLTGEVDPEAMKALYTHHLDPRELDPGDRASWGQASVLGNKPGNYQKADDIYVKLLEAHPGAGPEERADLRVMAAGKARQSVAFWDVVLSAPKSLTVAWVATERAANDAAARGDEAGARLWRDRAATIEESMVVGHRAVLDFYARVAGYSRAGHHGGGAGQWVDAHQVVAAQFLQHDSRDKDPHLHVHGPMLNKVLCADGKWRAIDGTLITAWKDAAMAVGERSAEAHATGRLGLSWRSRADGFGRELVGVEPESLELFSKRSAAITPAARKLIAQFKAATGREPSNRERAKLCEQATLVTRKGKTFGGETRDDQIARWAEEHRAGVGTELRDVAERLFTDQPASAGTDADGADTAGTGVAADRWSERDVLVRALAEVSGRRQSFTRSHVMRAISDALPGNLGISPEQVVEHLEALTDKAIALTEHLNPNTGPEGLAAQYYRESGESVFVKPGVARYATSEQLLGEAELRAAAVRRGAPAWSAEQAEEVIGWFAQAGRELGPDQAAALRGILTSGAAVEVLAAPAGTGKSFLIGTLADTWPHTGQPHSPASDQPAGGQPGEGPPEGGPRLFGLAYGQRQADVLREEGVTARNITAWLGGQTRLDNNAAQDGDEEFRLRRGDLVVVDEAGAAATSDLVAIHRRCEQAGAKLLLVGDSKQLAAVGAGGALADVAERGIAYELAEVRRFREEWEGPASLRLRDGDTSVVNEYAKHGRLVDAGTPEQAEDAASRAWLADTLKGREALLVVGSNEAAGRVSAALRAELVRLGKVEEAGVPLGMQGTVAGVGDLIQARRNAWHLKGWAGNTAPPVNRATYRVTAVHADGAGLTVAPVTGRDETGAEQLGEPMQLPGSYVNQHVTLGYASTVHAAHGRTVDAGYPVIGPGTDTAAAYVDLTRGRETNVAFVVTRNTPTDADTGETHTVAERSAAAVLADVIRPPEQDPNRTALTEAEQAAAEAAAISRQLDPMIAVIGDNLAGRTGRLLDQHAATGQLSEHHRLELAADEARTSLDQLLRSAELAGHDPADVLADAVTQGSLDKSRSVAQVLHYRIRTALKDQLTPRIDSYADLLPRDLPAEQRAGLHALAEAADRRRAELGAQLAADPTDWVREALGEVPDDPAERAAWETKAGWAAAYRELADHTDDTDHTDPLGPAPPAGLAEKHALFRTAHTHLALVEVGAEEEAMTEGQLRARVTAYEREQNWAPPYVADQLDATHEALRTRQQDATVWAAHAKTTTDPAERAQLEQAAHQARQEAVELAAQVTQLQKADDARALWQLETAVTRDKAQRAVTALRMRGIEPNDPEQRVTSEEWMAAHQAEQREADRHRPVTEHDLTDHQLDQQPEPAAEPVTEPTVELDGAAESGPADIREISAPDASERADPEQRRRVPLPDETAATVERAQAAVTEIGNRRIVEAHADLDDHGDGAEPERRFEDEHYLLEQQHQHYRDQQQQSEHEHALEA